MWLRLFVFLLVAVSAQAQDLRESPLTAEGLTQDAMSEVKNPHAYDYRKESFELEVGYDYVDEKNNFNNDGWHLGLALPSDFGAYWRFTVRRINVYNTKSSDLVGRTPFRQVAGSTRYEYGFAFLYSLMEGRSFTRFSPTLPDLQQQLFAFVGGHYTHLNQSLVPQLKDKPRELPGQKRGDPPWALEAGLRWQVFFPQSLGIFFEAGKVVPVPGYQRGLSDWTVYSSGFVWGSN